MAIECKEALPCPTVLRFLVGYEPESGALHWKHQFTPAFLRLKQPTSGRLDYWNRTTAGKPAFTSSSATGRKRGAVYRISVFAHRAAWAIYYGEWPTQEIDHINGDYADNRISNLRLASRAENARNRGAVKGSMSTYKGVYLSRASGKWFAQININGKSTHVGTFSSEDEAALAYNAAAKKHHGSFARLNVVKEGG